MAKLGKRTRSIREEVNTDRLYALAEAIDLLKKHSAVKFDETLELSLNLSVDPRRTDQMVRGVCVLPNGVGKNIRVAVFARGEKEQEAKSCGADLVGSEELVQEIQQGKKIEFDRCIATPDTMPLVSRLGKILGPRGLMPNPKVGTVTMDIKGAISNIKKGAVQFRAEKAGIVQAGVGKLSFRNDRLLENIRTLIDAVQKEKPANIKGSYLKRIALSSTMGLGIKIDTKEL